MEANAAAEGKAAMRWSDLSDDEGEVYAGVLLPERVVIGPDEYGFVRSIEFRIDEAGNKVKVTTTTRLPQPRISGAPRSVRRCRAWPKFGDAASVDDVSDRLTVLSREEIRLERPPASGSASANSIYVPPKRLAVPYKPGNAGKKKVSLRVRNWSVDADELDLEQLFGHFGPLRGVSIARNCKTGASKGIAVVNYIYETDAKRAMAALKGFGTLAMIT